MLTAYRKFSSPAIAWAAAMVQEFMEDPDFLGSAPYMDMATAYTFGSPGSDNINSDTADNRITNFYHRSDPVYQYAPLFSQYKLLQDLAQFFLPELGFNSAETDQVTAKLLNDIQPKAHEGTGTEIAYMGVDSGLLSPHVISQYILDLAGRTLTVNSGATLDIGSDFGATVKFAGSTGTLKIEDSLTFAGTVAGMTGQESIL